MRTGVVVDWASGLLVVALGVMLTGLAWLAIRQVQRIGRAAQARIALQRLIADQASEAIMLTDRAQRILSVNAAFEAITGYSAADVTIAAKEVIDMKTAQTMGAPISDETIHERMREGGMTDKTYDEELQALAAQDGGQ